MTHSSLESLSSLSGIGSIVDLASANAPLILPGNHWGVWTVLLSAAALGLWSEKTHIGRRFVKMQEDVMSNLDAISL